MPFAAHNSSLRDMKVSLELYTVHWMHESDINALD